ncbi:unnamed protein product [Absidia cylindrospora]
MTNHEEHITTEQHSPSFPIKTQGLNSPTAKLKKFFLFTVQDRNAKYNTTTTHISSKTTSPIREEDDEDNNKNDNSNNKGFIDDDTTIVDMTILQQQPKSKSNMTTANHLPITIPPPAQAKLGLKLQQSSPITFAPMMRSLSLSTTTPEPTALSSPTSIVEEAIRHQKELDDITVSIPSISIWTAAEQGDIATLTYYIQHHPNPVALLNKRDPKTECTLIHLAVSSSNNINPYNIVDLLLTHGADPCARNVYNVQALHTIPLHCVESPQNSLVLLLDHGADVNCRDGDGWTPLHYAARFCRPESLGSVLALLVQRGANLSAVDASHKTAMFALLANGDHLDAFTYLIQQQQNDNSGANTLMLPSRGNFWIQLPVVHIMAPLCCKPPNTFEWVAWSGWFIHKNPWLSSCQS